MTVEIPLTRGYVTIVDDEDADLAELKWYVFTRATGTQYARRGVWVPQTQQMRFLYLHRVIAERIIGRPLRKGEVVDHINCNGLDSRRENLRVCTHSENVRNQRLSVNNTSGYKGVTRWRNKWKAEICSAKRKHYLGLYDTPEAAHEAYCEAAKRLHGEFARFD